MARSGANAGSAGRKRRVNNTIMCPLDQKLYFLAGRDGLKQVKFARFKRTTGNVQVIARIHSRHRHVASFRKILEIWTYEIEAE